MQQLTLIALIFGCILALSLVGIVIYTYLIYKKSICKGLTCLAFYSYNLNTGQVFDQRVPTTRITPVSGFNALLIENISRSGKTLKGINLTVNSDQIVMVSSNGNTVSVLKSKYIDLNVGQYKTFLINMQYLLPYESVEIEEVYWS
jgi:hypothetical protein